MVGGGGELVSARSAPARKMMASSFPGSSATTAWHDYERPPSQADLRPLPPSLEAIYPALKAFAGHYVRILRRRGRLIHRIHRIHRAPTPGDGS